MKRRMSDEPNNFLLGNRYLLLTRRSCRALVKTGNLTGHFRRNLPRRKYAGFSRALNDRRKGVFNHSWRIYELSKTIAMVFSGLTGHHAELLPFG
jgi:hypothetical protein